ncbi:MAG TPA: DHH family phosphoesterase, partial [Candidatus Saccharibacteria bacterium]|nr:DHH family phosphoesterase [Candidatus Saccharibacteria bacterium]
MNIFDEILRARGLEGRARDAFLNPSYDARHDPFLLPDMDKAVERLVMAHERQENVTIYGDYDIDGLTASTVLIDAFESFGFENVDIFIPNRFVEGYGLTVEAVEKIAATGAQLIVTVDCGSLSEKEIIRANELGVDVIVTDHHNVAPVQPPAVAVINPKRLLQEYPEVYENFILQDLSADFLDAVGSSQDNSVSAPLSSAELAGAQTSSTSKGAETELSGFTKTPKKSADKSSASLYPFLDLAGVGVAFKLVQALQTRLDGLPEGQEKWLLDLVALGTVCDVVTLVDENRAIVYWGLKVMAKTRRPGLRALMAVAGVDPDKITTRSLGFALGPRMNAAGRLETAQYALDMLLAKDRETALEKAQLLDEMNQNRRSEQDKILKEAIIQAERYVDDSVLVVSAPGWNHGIIGIVAAKLLEKYKKPTYVLE